VLLWDTYEPQRIWMTFALIGAASMVGLVVFDQITRRNLKAEPWLLIALTLASAAFSYGWTWAIGFALAMVLWLALRAWAPQTLPQGSET
jgi:hypothetical protein